MKIRPTEDSLLRKWCIPVLLGLAVILVHSSVLYHDFAISDEYNTLDMAQSGGLKWFDNGITITGRPITSIFVAAGFRLTDGIEDLTILRAAATLFAVCFFLTLYGILRKSGIPPSLAGSFALIIGLTPAFSSYVYWTVQWPYPLGAALALLCGWGVFQAICDNRYRLPALLPTGLVLVCIPMIYQPLPGYFMIPVVASILFSAWTPRKFRACAYSLVFYFACMVAYVVAFKIYDVTIAQEAWPEHAARNRINTDVFAKAVFLWETTLPRILASWSYYFGGLTRNLSMAVISVLALAGLLAMPGPAPLKDRITRALLICCAFGLTIAPLAASASNQAPTRTLGPAVSLVALLSVAGLWQLMRRTREATATIPFACIAASVAVTGFSVILWGAVIPQKWELQTIRGKLHSLEEAPDWIHFIHPGEFFSPRSIFPEHDTEYNFNSSYYKWSPAPMINILVREKIATGDWETVPDSYVYVAITGARFESPIDIPVIDTKELFYGHSDSAVPELELDSVVGKISPLPRSQHYYYSPWLGFFYSGNLFKLEEGMSLFLPRIGHAIVVPTKNASIWIHTAKDGWVATHPQVFPFAQRAPDEPYTINLLAR